MKDKVLPSMLVFKNGNIFSRWSQKALSFPDISLFKMKGHFVETLTQLFWACLHVWVMVTNTIPFVSSCFDVLFSLLQSQLPAFKDVGVKVPLSI